MAELWYPKRLGDVVRWAKFITRELGLRTVIGGINTSIQQGKNGRAVNAGGGGPGGGDWLHAWKCIAASPPEGQTGANWVKVNLHSMVRHKFEDASSKVTVTGLDQAFKLEGAKQHVWLKGDVQPMHDDPEAQPILTVDHGAKWGGKYPQLIEWNTDDGTANGSTGTLPEGHVLEQKAFYMPIAYTVKGDTDPFTPLAKNHGLDLGNDVFLVQQAFNHLVIGTGCISGSPNAIYGQIDPTAAQPED